MRRHLNLKIGRSWISYILDGFFKTTKCIRANLNGKKPDFSLSIFEQSLNPKFEKGYIFKPRKFFLLISGLSQEENFPG